MYGYSCIRHFRGRAVLEAEHGALAICCGELPDVEDWGSRVLDGRAGPVDRLGLLHLLVGYTELAGGDCPHVVPDILGGLPVKALEAHLLCQHADDLPVVLRLAGAVDGLPDTVDTALAAGERAVLLGKAGAGQDNVCILAALVPEDILDDEEVEFVKRSPDMVRVGVGDHRVQAEDVHRLDRVAALGDLLGQGHTVPVGQGTFLHEPCLLHLGTVLGNGNCLVAGEDVRVCTHVAGALHVVLATERVDTDTRAADIAGEQREVAHRTDIVGTGGQLGDAEAVDDDRVLCLCILAGKLLDRLLRDTVDLRSISILLDRLFEVIEAFRALLDELLVLEAFLDDPVHHVVGERNVGRRVEPDPLVGKPCGWAEPRVNDNDRDSLLLGLHDAAAGKRVGLDCVGTPHDDQVGVQDILERVGGCTGTERERETGNGRSVADTGTVVDVVGLEGNTGPLLQGVAVLVDGTARGLETEGLGAELVGGLLELLCDQVNGFVPGGFLELVVLLDQRLCQPVRASGQVPSRSPLWDRACPR